MDNPPLFVMDRWPNLDYQKQIYHQKYDQKKLSQKA
jgi:hypothetical protein